MRIAKYDNVDLHWWGHHLLLIRNLNEYYIFEEEEVFFVEHLCKTNVVAEVFCDIARELEVDSALIESFINVFLENFSDYFYLAQDEITQSLCISGKKLAYYPLEIHISLTDRCIQKCKHCYKSASSCGKDVDFKDLCDFLDRMIGYVPYLCLSGGEPTLHPDFIRIMEKYSTFYNVCVLTSGVRISPLLDVIAKADRGMVVSLYSSIPAIHDEFAGYIGSYNEIMKSLNIALANGIHTAVTTLLSRNNFDDIADLVEMIVPKGIKTITIGKITSVGRAKENDLEVLNIIPDDLREKLLCLKKKYNIIKIPDNETCENILLPFSPLKCSAGTLSWSINEHGQIHPCGVCSMEGLSLGLIAPFDETILTDRTSYIERVKNLPLVKNMERFKVRCPFDLS